MVKISIRIHPNVLRNERSCRFTSASLTSMNLLLSDVLLKIDWKLPFVLLSVLLVPSLWSMWLRLLLLSLHCCNGKWKIKINSIKDSTKCIENKYLHAVELITYNNFEHTDHAHRVPIATNCNELDELIILMISDLGCGDGGCCSFVNVNNSKIVME